MNSGLLPHANPGLLTDADLDALRGVSISQGIMVESTSERLCAKGGAHYGSPDKLPAARLDTIRRAGERAVPFTSGILIGTIKEFRTRPLDGQALVEPAVDISQTEDVFVVVGAK